MPINIKFLKFQKRKNNMRVLLFKKKESNEREENNKNDTMCFHWSRKMMVYN